MTVGLSLSQCIGQPASHLVVWWGMGRCYRNPPRCGKSDFQDGGKGEIKLQAVGKILQIMQRCNVEVQCVVVNAMGFDWQGHWFKAWSLNCVPLFA